MLEAGPESRIYAGLKPKATADVLRRAVASKTVAEHLAWFTPRAGDGVLVPAGTVHSLGDVVVFEVQENSDVTFRLYDWDHIDTKTGQPRPLQIDRALACIDFDQGAMGPVVPLVEEAKPVLRERLFCCEHFGLSRIRGDGQFLVGTRKRRECWFASPAAASWSTRAPTMPSARRRFPLAGLRRSVLLPDERHDHDVGHFAAGRKRQEMKQLIVFDLDGTLAESKASIDAEMATLLGTLLGVVKVAVISGGNWPQFEKQVLANLPHDKHLVNLSLLPTCGTKFYQHTTVWEKIYSEDFTAAEKGKIICALKKSIATSAFNVEKVWGEVIQDRGSQITFSALGQQAPLRKKEVGPRLRQAEENQGDPR